MKKEKTNLKKEIKIADNKKPANSDNNNFPIVGIGASAGGLEALEQFFQFMPNDSGMAFVVIQHLDPDYVGMMPELLQRTTSMKVLQVTDNMPVKPNHVYIIPPNKTMSVLNGTLYLFVPVEIRGLRLPIDFFFRSLAEDRLDKSICIVLSGMGSDGSLGVKAIKEKNGIVLIQDAADAKFNGMPTSAAKAVVADIIAPANELPAKLIAFLKHAHIPAIDIEKEIKVNSNLEKIIILLRTQTGQDFSLYKKNTLFRRIERRMNVHQIDKIANYVRFLQENPTETDILFKELLIGVTSFFRDAAVWQHLKDKILPELFMQLPNGQTLRAWVAGCSTGEEAYSLAIVFKEALEADKSNKNFNLQIFASDLDKDAIEIARKGVFAANIAADVSPGRLNKFFTKAEEGFRVNTAIREMIVFAPHNLIKDPPFTKLDILSCRNLLIYLEPELQKKLMILFHYSLNPDGIMLLGSAENENSQNNIFTPIDTKLKFYKRSITPISTELLDFPSSFSHKKTKSTETLKTLKVNDNIQSLAEQLLLQRFAPASVLINDQGDILFITGRTGKYLEPAAGKANMNIYAMAREGLSVQLTGAIRKALQNYEPHILRNLKIGTNGGTQFVDVTIQQIEKPSIIKGTIMIVFADVATIIKPEKTAARTMLKTSNISMQELEFEIQRVNEEMQSTREEMQTSQEELKSTNEELQSSNEELQSTNEELTTSKEEMQSLNEELQTVNAELQSKISEYVQANNDMKNLLNSTDIATLFLDKEMNIRRFTDQVCKIIKLRTSDIGRPFTEMVSDLQYPDIEHDAKNVLHSLVFKETDIEASNKRWFTVRIMPYRTFDDRIDGLVITFVDISVAKKLETELAIANKAEKGKLDDNLIIANKEVISQNMENKQLETDLKKAKDLLQKHNLL